MSSKRQLLATCLLTSAITLLHASVSHADVNRVEFSRDIRPLLADKCFACHGPDKEERKARLRLDTRADLFKKTRRRSNVVAGKPDESELFRRLVDEDEDERMPPAESGKSLTKEEIELVRRWIEQGAEWQGHWSLITPTRPALPEVEKADWVHNPIDRFTLARLEASKLTPNGEAERRTLVRRVTFDLTGLPPTPEEVAAFLADDKPGAYERLVDRLLASPHYGEHLARFWLDGARYGDTHGLHLDNFRSMWPYRDWVIRAYNENKPFDEFTIEQLAGDLLPNPTLAQRVATGFNRCNVTTGEGGSIDEEYYVRYAVDRVETTSTVFMGLTAGCAACHTHKFDPLTQKEFYELFAFFNNITERAMDGNRSEVPPIVRVPMPDAQRKIDAANARVGELETKLASELAAAEKAYESWLTSAERSSAKAPPPPPGLVAHFPLDESGPEYRCSIDPKRVGKLRGTAKTGPGKHGQAYVEAGGHIEFADTDRGGAGDWDTSDAFSYGAWIRSNGKANGALFARMDDRVSFNGWDLYISNRKYFMHLIHKWPGVALRENSGDIIKPNVWEHVFVTYDGSGTPEGYRLYVDGKEVATTVDPNTLAGKPIRAKVPLTVGQRYTKGRTKGVEIDDIRLFSRELSANEVAQLAGTDPLPSLLAIPREKRNEAQKKTLRDYFFREVHPASKKIQAEIAKLRATISTESGRSATTLVMEERKTPRGAYVLFRGRYDQRREKVEPGTPAALPPLPEGAPRNRLGYARWLVHRDHPLTARVAVNRYWQQKFGIGIVRTSEDFGSQGEPPTHPKLLDWLAVEFVESGWNIKALQKLLVMSATYRQSSRVEEKSHAIDPENRLYARGPRFRLDAEMLRDQALYAGELLVDRVGGPSVKPPQPDGLWYAVGYTSSNTARFKADAGDKIFRRSLYTFWKRTSPPPQMTTFDAPSREACTVRRERTNTPLQALLLLNEEQYFESARSLAQIGVQRGLASPKEIASFLFERVTIRPPSAEDLEDLLATYRSTRALFASDPEAAKATIRVGSTKPDPKLDAVELAAWTMVASLILNLDEVITKG